MDERLCLGKGHECDWKSESKKGIKTIEGKAVPLSLCMSYNKLNTINRKFVLIVDAQQEPKSYQEAC